VLAGIDLVRFTPEIRDLAGGIAFQPRPPRGGSDHRNRATAAETALPVVPATPGSTMYVMVCGHTPQAI
jgi:hypothetical protein